MATTYNTGYLKALVKKKLQNDPYFSDLDVLDALNEAQDDLAVFAHVNVEEGQQDTVVGQAEYDWPVDALQLIGVNYNGYELNEITYEEYRRKGGITSESSADFGDPSDYYVRSNTKVGLYPSPGQEEILRIFYVPKPTDLVDDADVPAIPRVYTQALVYYATYKMLENDAARQKEAEYHYNLYKSKRAEHTVSLAASRKRKVRNTAAWR